MIWTVLLGVVLTSVFFFFAMRLRENTATQRDTIALQSAKAYLTSYADYLMANPSDGPINFDGITGTLTNEGYELEGFLDSGKSVTYESYTGSLKVEWNKCSDNKQGDLLLTDNAKTAPTELPPFIHDPATCPPGPNYDDMRTVSVTNDFKLTAIDAPFYYRLTSQSGMPITDNKWHLNASMTLPYGKKVEIER